MATLNSDAHVNDFHVGPGQASCHVVNWPFGRTIPLIVYKELTTANNQLILEVDPPHSGAPVETIHTMIPTLNHEA